ncbi:hypothetical protein DRE_07607 [Drechslerella stenobrocha 248]|uniref:Uncharacterized protein n=1 Tax=Drechslerella stenobrocha 248 TaxID=1043628 RepID=W7HHS0_9PEZI|nr:hypothetical protein DRE_07607 [Drechslerella stenobrocha 248]
MADELGSWINGNGEMPSLTDEELLTLLAAADASIDPSLHLADQIQTFSLPSLPPLQENFKRKLKAVPASSSSSKCPRKNHYIRIPLTIAPRFLRPALPSSSSTSSPSMKPYIPPLQTPPPRYEPNSSNPTTATAPPKHTSTHPIPSPPPSYPHSHAVHFPKCGHTSSHHVYAPLQRPRARLCICPYIPAVLPKVALNDGDNDGVAVPSHSRMGRIVGAGLELQVDEESVCDACTERGRRRR